MWPGNSSDSSYAPTSFLGNTICSCLGLLCCCWICQDCLGRQRGRQQGPTTPLIGPPPGPMDDRLGQLGGPHNPFGMSNPPGPPHPMDHHRPGHLGGPHRPFGMSNPPGPRGPIAMDDHLTQLGGPHSPFGMSDPPGPPRPPIQYSSHIHHGPPHPHGPPGVHEPPRVPSIQPGLL